MKTLVIVFHPKYSESVRNKMIIDQLQNRENVTVRIIQGPVDVQTERDVLKQFERIVFQYPVYWWAMPAVGKSYLETVVNTETEVLANKKIKIVQTLGSGRGGYGTRDMQVMKTIWEVITDFCRAKLEEQVFFYANDSAEVARKIATDLAK
ncbi:NADPH_oxidoreductase [Hexamita inflata]|uniref:NADPH oxidoreductase n=1 Tax=Hexamita inflata TaxID=28002 RepID=A0AA86TXN7_9EUKA|nr:NADPH oxidoreductase [Hexamita inflata]